MFIVDIVNTTILYLLVKLPLIFVNASLSAYINVAFSLISFVIIPPQMISTAMGPLISQETVSEDKRRMNNILRMGLSLIFVFQGFTIISFSYFGDIFINLLYGSEYLIGSVFIFFGFLLTSTIQSLATPYGLYIRNTGGENLFFIGKTLSLLSFVCFSVLFLNYSNRKGIGISISYFISASILFAFYLYFTLNKNQDHSINDVKRILKWLIFIFLSIVSSMFIISYLPNLSYRFLICIANLVLLVSFLIVFKLINVKSLKQDVKVLIKNMRKAP